MDRNWSKNIIESHRVSFIRSIHFQTPQEFINRFWENISRRVYHSSNREIIFPAAINTSKWLILLRKSISHNFNKRKEIHRSFLDRWILFLFGNTIVIKFMANFDIETRRKILKYFRQVEIEEWVRCWKWFEVFCLEFKQNSRSRIKKSFEKIIAQKNSNRKLKSQNIATEKFWVSNRDENLWMLN